MKKQTRCVLFLSVALLSFSACAERNKEVISDEFVSKSLNDLVEITDNDIKSIVVEKNRDKIVSKIDAILKNKLGESQENMLDLSTYKLSGQVPGHKNCDFFKLSVSLKSIDDSLRKVKSCIAKQCGDKEFGISMSAVNKNYQYLNKDLDNCVKGR